MKIRGITRKAGGLFRVYFYNGKMLMLHYDETMGSGYSQWADYFGVNDLSFEEGAEGELINGDEELIDWQDLPPLIQAQIEKMIYIFDGQ